MSHKCEICDKEDWHDLDYLRSKGYWFDMDLVYDEPIGFKVCKECGFVTYTPRWDEAHLKKQYNSERPRVTYPMLVMTRKKNHFHNVFIPATDLVKKGKEANILDIGCAFGAIRELFPEANISGTEYAESLANYASRQYKINMIEDIGELPNKSQDLIILYHTLEHVIEPKKLLTKCRELLKDDGILYVAVPDYLDLLREVSGNACISFEYLYHLNHQNVFSIQSMDNLLKITGFETTNKDNQVYGYATINKKCEASEEITKTDYKRIDETLQLQKKAIEIFAGINTKTPYKDGEMTPIEIAEAALAIYPKYLDAYLFLSVQKEYFQDFKENKKIFKRAYEVIGNSSKIRMHEANILKQWSDAKDNPNKAVTNNIRKAEALYAEIAAHDPGNSEVWKNLFDLNIMYFKNMDKAQLCAEKLLNVHPAMIAEVSEQMGYFLCQ